MELKRYVMLNGDETWKDIEGYEGLYQVSNLGRVKSLSRKVFHCNRVTHKEEKILSTINNKNGYVRVELSNGNKKKYLVHRLVAQAFIQNNENKKYVNHINRIKNDNRVENLEWATASENIKYSYNILAKYKNNNLIKTKQYKPVVQIDVSKDKIVAVFNSVNEAHRISGVHNYEIIKMCRGERSFYGEYAFKYLNDIYDVYKRQSNGDYKRYEIGGKE